MSGNGTREGRGSSGSAVAVTPGLDKLSDTVTVIIAQHHEDRPELSQELAPDDLEDGDQVLVAELNLQGPDCLHVEVVLDLGIGGRGCGNDENGRPGFVSANFER